LQLIQQCYCGDNKRQGSTSQESSRSISSETSSPAAVPVPVDRRGGPKLTSERVPTESASSQQPLNGHQFLDIIGWSMASRSVESLVVELLPRFDQGNIVVCCLCGLQVCHRSMIKPMIEHAAEHSRKILYKCRHCVLETNSEEEMLTHVRISHGTSKSDVAFENCIDQYKVDLLPLLMRCYDMSDNGNQVDRSVVRDREIYDPNLENESSIYPESSVSMNSRNRSTSTRPNFRFKYSPGLRFAFVGHRIRNANEAHKCPRCPKSFRSKVVLRHHLKVFH